MQCKKKSLLTEPGISGRSQTEARIFNELGDQIVTWKPYEPFEVHNCHCLHRQSCCYRTCTTNLGICLSLLVSSLLTFYIFVWRYRVALLIKE